MIRVEMMKGKGEEIQIDGQKTRSISKEKAT